MTRARRPARPGFTLVELLVVTGLILVLLGLTLAVSSSGITDSYKATSASDRVSGWLIIAKSKAQREKKPAGVRFVLSGSQIREAQYIEVPDPYAPLPATPALPVVSPRLLFANPGTPAQRRVFVANANTADLTQSVFAGDVLFVPEFNTLHTVNSFGPPAAPAPATLPPGSLEVFVRAPALLPAVAAGAEPTLGATAFGFHRKAQPAIGEPTLQLTGDMVVDAAPGLSLVQAVSGEIDVLFAPNGEVMNAPSGKTVFWVRNVRLPTPRPNGPTGPDLRADYEAAGQMALVVVYSKTGTIATQPVTLPQSASVAGHNPYSATTDAVNTGL